MTYHDNDVRIELDENYRLLEGSFTVNTFFVTEGQDPDDKITEGLVVPFTDTDKLTFRVGRKGSDKTAKWFNDRVPPSQNTFGHEANELNFAVIGTLKMRITGGILSGRQETYTFNNVAFAQGHAGLANNWWFGQQGCMRWDPERVIAMVWIQKGGLYLSFF